MGDCRVVNLRTEAYDVYIGRAGKGHDGYFGNPFRVRSDRCAHCKQYHTNNAIVVARFETWFVARIKSDPEFQRRVAALAGKTLGCFCKPAPCHGDIIASYVNSLEKP